MRIHNAQPYVYVLPQLLEIYQKPLKYGRLHIPATSGSPHGVHIRGVPLYVNDTHELHTLIKCTCKQGTPGVLF